MKIYLWKNKRSESDFTEENTLAADHSSCLVVLAENREQALEAAKKYVRRFAGEPVEIPSDKPGVVVYADGDC